MKLFRQSEALEGRYVGPAAQSAPVQAEAIAPALAAVQARFRDRIVERVLEFEGLMQDVEAGRSPALALVSIADLAHKIVGVAATLGYPRAGDLAAEVEQRIRQGSFAGAAPQVTWRAVQPGLEALLDELEAMLGG